MNYAPIHFIVVCYAAQKTKSRKEGRSTLIQTRIDNNNKQDQQLIIFKITDEKQTGATDKNSDCFSTCAEDACSTGLPGVAIVSAVATSTITACVTLRTLTRWTSVSVHEASWGEPLGNATIQHVPYNKYMLV